MVKAKATLKDGRTLIVMGISDGNISRLKEGKPLYFDPAQLKIEPGDTIAAITLFYGKDEAELTRMMQMLIGPETEVFNVPRGDDRPQ